MKKLNAIFFIIVFATSLIVCSCSASGQVSVKKQQSEKIVNK